MTGADLLVVFLAVGVGATVKGVTGIGLPLTAVPLMTLAIGAEDAVVSMAVPNLVSNVGILVGTRSSRGEARGLARFVVVGMAAAVGGAWILTSVPERWLMWALAAIVLCFLVWRLRARDPYWNPAVRRRGWAPVAALAGVAQGSIGISGPIVAPWLQGHGYRRETFMFATAFVFLMTGIAQVIGLSLAGVWNTDRVAGAAVAGAAVALWQPLAFRYGRRLDQQGFERMVTAVLWVAAISLVVRAG